MILLQQYMLRLERLLQWLADVLPKHILTIMGEQSACSSDLIMFCVAGLNIFV